MGELKASLFGGLYLIISGANIFAVFGSICISVYYISMLKRNVVNKDYQRSWVKYFKSWFKK
jgi:hypothetical protein